MQDCKTRGIRRRVRLSIGIVGLPNVGKSTLFNALSSKQAEAANYPFCTIEPNVAVVNIPDPRFDALVKKVEPLKQVPATVDFVDIAGLVKGASQGEGKGNAFLSHIREVNAIAHVVRCFEDPNIVHVEGRIDPLADVDTIHTELVLKDLETVQKRLDKAKKNSKSGNAKEQKAADFYQRVSSVLDANGRASDVVPNDTDEIELMRDLFLLTSKPVFYVANVSEEGIVAPEQEPLLASLRARAAAEHTDLTVICASIEAEIMQLQPEERPDYLNSIGLEEPSLHHVIRTGYRMLDLITYFTAGKQEVRAWTIPKHTKAPQAAGAIHTDFERGFIRAEVIKWQDWIALGSEAACRNAGKMATEGKDYVVEDGDVMHFRFNV